MTLASWAADLVTFLLPGGCVACGAWIPDDGASRPVCGPCLARLRPPPSPSCPRCGHPLGTGRSPEAGCPGCRDWTDRVTFARSAVVLERPASDLVRSLKYQGWPEVAEVMAERMARLRLPRGGPQPTLVTPVPTTAARKRLRGYNQAEVLAERYAERVDLPMARALRRRGDGVPSQTGLDPSMRRANVADAFVPAAEAERLVSGHHVLLVDDVLTTGATSSAAAGVLLAAGAGSVGVVTFARALPERARSGSE